MRALFCAALVVCWLWPAIGDADTSSAPADPCAGPAELLAMLDRPTVSDSACAAKPNETLIEAGYANEVAHGASESTIASYPQLELRFGATQRWEWKILAPTYNRQTDFAPNEAPTVSAGYGDVTLGVKKEFGYSDRWIYSADAALTLPTGAPAFSNGSTDWVVNLIVGYNLSPQVGLGGQLGFSSHSLHPIVVLTDQFTNRLQGYAEIFGTTNAGEGVGSSYAVDGGLQCLLSPRFEIDLEITRSLGAPGGVATRAFGFGAGWKV